ncbi:uracil-DNA glycosylase family protein [Paraburkholderia graminis]|uniref:Type-4 uracil-DNA glycosylase n=1 Tax=Paraburkholderia graminis TaxID=60548 RepID=A0ABD5CEL5_9BURK|nr:uracil-DNA glycosylase family protein [Paraburkholderia graminis]MDQ0623454.1 uracil-DNA glycosylase family 4 [Paraburkholderia graminis]MDR6203571.1 uracil-DNA glycosylase family 4 [Paraburkholderia graminis]
MALHESVFEEFGLAPRWVRRGMGAVQEAAAGLSDEQQGTRADDAVHARTSVETGPRADGVQTPRAAALPRERSQSGEPAGRAAESTRFVESAQQGAEQGGLGAPPASQARQQQRVQPAADGGDPRTAQPLRTPEPERGPSIAASDEPAVAQPSRPSEPSSFDAPPDDGFAWFDDLPLHPPGDAEADAAIPALPAIDTLDWDALSERVSTCERCRLCEKRTKTVFGVGDRNADWMLIGEAPGENEDRVGEPFVGQAGKLLDNMLRSLTLARDSNVYIANVIKCRPPGNRNPEPDEVARCEPYLQRQVALVKPKLIVALGRFAAQSLLKTDASISSLRGRVHEYEGVPVIVTYHPAYLLRSLPDKAKAWADLCLARDTWREAGGAPSNAASQ